MGAPSAAVQSKAATLLREGRVTMLDARQAVVRGASGTYLTFVADAALARQAGLPEDVQWWHCTCPSSSMCSHALAVEATARIAARVGR